MISLVLHRSSHSAACQSTATTVLNTAQYYGNYNDKTLFTQYSYEKDVLLTLANTVLDDDLSYWQHVGLRQ